MGWWRSVPQHVQPVVVFFHHCMHGGQRPKRTGIATSIPALSGLARSCDGHHTHLPWGRVGVGWATVAQVEYPGALCRRWAQLAVDHLQQQGCCLCQCGLPCTNTPQPCIYAQAHMSELCRCLRPPGLMSHSGAWGRSKLEAY